MPHKLDPSGHHCHDVSSGNAKDSRHDPVELVHGCDINPRQLGYQQKVGLRPSYRTQCAKWLILLEMR